MNRMPKSAAAVLLLSFLVYGGSTWAAIQPDRIHVAELKKTEFYVKDGLFVGGDRNIDGVTVTDIRRAVNKEFERLVIDLQGTKKGEPAAIPRPPYFQVSVSEEEQRMTFTLWGKPKLAFKPQAVIDALKKSPNIQNVELLPRMDEDTWTFVIGLKPGKSVEIFELGNPVRVIVDIKGGRATAKK